MTHRITVEQVLEWGPDQDREELRAHVDGRESITLEELWQLEVPYRDRLWIAVRCEALDHADLRRWCADCAWHVLGVWEREHPEDRRPHVCIDAARAFAAGAVGPKELAAAAEPLRKLSDTTSAYTHGENAALSALMAVTHPLTPPAAELAAWCASDARGGEEPWQIERFMAYHAGEARPLRRRRRRRKSGAARNDVRIRLADDEDGPRIRELLGKAGFTLEFVEFRDLRPYWLVALYDGEIVGCLQYCRSKPIARAELLGIEPELSPTLRSLVVRDLWSAVAATARLDGAQAISAHVPFELKAYQRKMKHRGWVRTSSGNLMLWRL